MKARKEVRRETNREGEKKIIPFNRGGGKRVVDLTRE